ADRKLVACLELSTLEAAEGTQRVGRARAKNHGHIDAACDGNVGTGALFQEIEREFLAALHLERRPRLARLAIEPGWQLGTRGRNHGVIRKLELGSHEDSLDFFSTIGARPVLSFFQR